MDQKQIQFFKDRKPLGIAFSNMKTDEVTPIFSLKHPGSKLTLMPETYSRGGVPVAHLLDRMTDLGHVLMALSGTRTIPMHRLFVRRAFNNWKVWMVAGMNCTNICVR